MGYRLGRQKNAAEEVRRVALDQLEKAIAEISDPLLPLEKRIHAVRKRFKKLRSLFRLLRSVDPQTAEHENARFRRLGRELSSMRDNDVLISTLQKITQRHSQRKDSSPEIERLERSLTDEQQKNLHHPSRKTDPLHHVELQLQGAKEALLDWQPSDYSYRDLVAEFLKQYRRGRKSLFKAEDDPSSERMHDLRKRTKDYGHQLRLLREFWDGPAKSRLRQLERAGLKLGRDHDLAMLSERVEEKLRSTRRTRDLKILQRRIRHRRDGLYQDCLSLCHKLYREKGKKFRKKLSIANGSGKIPA